MEKGIDLNEADIFGSTCLHIATQERYSHIALALIELGADLNVQDMNGNCPIHLAIIHEDYRVVRRLLVHNARLDIKNEDGLLPSDMEKTKDIHQLVNLISFPVQCPAPSHNSARLPSTPGCFYSASLSSSSFSGW